MLISGIILAGGKSSRMGSNKALLKIDGLSMIERVAKTMSKVCSELVIAGGNSVVMKMDQFSYVPDIYPGCGSLAGIHAGLLFAKNYYSFVSACDTPFLDENLIIRLVKEAEGYDAVLLKVGDFIEPLFALYNKSCITAIENSLINGIYKVSAPLSKVRWKPVFIKPDDFPEITKILMNINTPADYEKAKLISQS